MEHRPEAKAEIRPYKPSDQEGLRWLFARTPPWGRTYPRPQPLPPELEEPLASYAICVVAVEQDQDGEALVGMIAAEEVEASSSELPAFARSTKKRLRLHWVLVAPERWRLGIGRRLTEAALDWALINGFEAALLETTVQQKAAISLYESMGFDEIGRSTVGGYQLVWFERGLG